MFSRKPILMEYDFKIEDIKDTYYFLNIVNLGNEKCYSFRCPNKNCGRPVKIGIQKCPFCTTRLKWKYPFKISSLKPNNTDK